MHRRLQGDNDTSEIGISNVVDLMKSWIEVENERWNDFGSWMRKNSNGNKKEKINRIWIRVCLSKLLDLCVTILIVIFIFQ
jgi:hypothetical protein